MSNSTCPLPSGARTTGLGAAADVVTLSGYGRVGGLAQGELYYLQTNMVHMQSVEHGDRRGATEITKKRRRGAVRAQRAPFSFARFAGSLCSMSESFKGPPGPSRLGLIRTYERMGPEPFLVKSVKKGYAGGGRTHSLDVGRFPGSGANVRGRLDRRRPSVRAGWAPSLR